MPAFCDGLSSSLSTVGNHSSVQTESLLLMCPTDTLVCHCSGPSAFWTGVNWEPAVAAGQSGGPELQGSVGTAGAQEQGWALQLCSVCATALCGHGLRELHLGKQQENTALSLSSHVPCLLPPR